MSAALLTHLIVPSIVLVLLAITAIYLSRITFNKGADLGQREASEFYSAQIESQEADLWELRNRLASRDARIARIKRNATQAIQQMEDRHQRQLAVFEQQRDELERNAITLERKQTGEIINLLRLSSPLLHAGQQYEAARSADDLRLALQKKLLQLRLVEHENETASAAGEGTA